jgi:hypothetical protein
MSTETGSDVADRTKSRISGKEATYVAMAAAKYPPVKVGAPDNSEQSSGATQTTPNLPAPIEGSGDGDGQRRAPPRVRKPSPTHNQFLAPTADLEGYRARLREAFGNTMSDEFVMWAGRGCGASKVPNARRGKRLRRPSR